MSPVYRDIYPEAAAVGNVLELPSISQSISLCAWGKSSASHARRFDVSGSPKKERVAELWIMSFALIP